MDSNRPDTVGVTVVIPVYNEEENVAHTVERVRATLAAQPDEWESVLVNEGSPDGTLDVLMVKIHTDEGLTGIGEVTSQSYVCKACFEAPRSAARRHGLASILVGEDPRDVEGV